MDASQLGQLIDRLEMLSSHRRADILTSERAISISFTQPNAPTRLELRISCEQLDWQLSSMTQICNHFSSSLFLVEVLGIKTTQSPSRQDDVGGEQWLELVRAFGGAKDFRVAGVHSRMTNILRGLHPADGGHTTDTIVLPALRNLRIQKRTPIVGPLWDAAQSFITSRQLSRRPVVMYVSGFLCHICNTNFTLRHELKRHLVEEHTPQKVCPYCGKKKHDHLFPKHLKDKHPEVLNPAPPLPISAVTVQ
ncbi:hypothetical protein BJY52DRAFT_1243645 [Lactarius psammicola]|nr:hypothetical protein BJY52DRAFT_1243645 [Lactarius psammicola]